MGKIIRKPEIHTRLRIITWNIGDLANELMPQFAGMISAANPDVVLITEARQNLGFNQIETIARMAQYPFWNSTVTASLGVFRGIDKIIGVISKFPLEDPNPLQNVWDGPEQGNYVTLEVQFNFAGHRIFLYAVRNTAYHLQNNIQSLNILRDRIHAVSVANSPQPVILACGDFNGEAYLRPLEFTDPDRLNTQPDQILDFIQQTNLIDASVELSHPVDFDPTRHSIVPDDLILFRGPFNIASATEEQFSGSSSDHPWTLVDLITTQKFKGRFLHQPLNFPQPFRNLSGAVSSYDLSDDITLQLTATTNPLNLVTIRLVLGPHVTWEKHIDFHNSAGNSRSIAIKNTEPPVAMSVPINELDGAFIVLSKLKPLNHFFEISRFFIKNMQAGQTATFTWNRD